MWRNRSAQPIYIEVNLKPAYFALITLPLIPINGRLHL